MNNLVRVAIPTRRLKMVSSLALVTVALVVIAGEVLIQRLLFAQSGDSRLLSLAGRQGVLVEELCKTTLVIRSSSNPASRTRSVEELRQTLFQLERGHIALQRRDREFGLVGENSRETRWLFAKLDPDFQAITGMARGFLRSVDLHAGERPGETGISGFIKGLLAHERAFQEGMERIVLRYGNEANERDRYEEKIRLAVGGATLLLLLIERLLVFRPALKNVSLNQAQLLSVMVDDAPEIISLKDPEGRYILVNRSFERAFNVSRTAVLGKTAHALFPKDVADSMARNDARALSADSALDVEETVPAGAGNRTFSSSKVALSHIHGKPYALCTKSVDITGRKRAEARLAAEYSVAQILAQSLSLAEANPRILEAISKALNWDTGLLWIVYPPATPPRLVATWPAEPLDAGESGELARRVWSGGQALWIPDMCKDSDFCAGNPARKEKRHTGFAFPIRLGNEILAVAEFFSPEIRVRDNEMIRSLSILGNQIGQFASHKRIEEALHLSEGRLLQFAETVDQVFWIVDTGLTKAIYVSPAYEKIWGRSCESLFAEPKSWIEAIHPDDREHFLQARSKILEGGYDEEYRIVRPDGSIRWISDRGLPMNDAGQVHLACGTAQDISFRKEAEARLRDSEERFRQLAQNVNELFWISNLDNTETLYVSPAYETIWGRSCESLYADPHSWGKSIHPEDRELVFGSLHKQASGEYNLEHRIVHADGSIRWVWVRVFPVRNAAGELYRLAGIAQDITERKCAENALQRAKCDAERANQAKSEFLSRMSHELRTPLNAILGFGQLLEVADLSHDDRESTGQITAAGRHLLKLVNELLDISRIEAGRMSLSREPVHVGDALYAAMDLVQPLAAVRHIRVTGDLQRNCDWHVLADEQRLKQVLLNLLSNAVNYNRDSGSVRVSAREVAAGQIRIEIADTGCGICSRDLPRLFLPFERLQPEHRQIQGAGLGLALSKHLVEAMGGTVGVESVAGTGSTFWIELPLVEGPMERLQVDDEPRVSFQAAEPLEDMQSVLYIEDNASNLRLLERALSKRPGLRLLTAANGRQGLECVRAQDPDLILLDLHLPDISGEEVLRTLRQDRKTRAIPVIVISADATPGSIARLENAGARHYVTKPLNIRHLLGVMDEVLQKETPVNA